MRTQRKELETKKILSDGSIILLGDFIVKMKGLIFLPLVIAEIGLRNYGILVQALLAPGIVAGICSLSLGASFVRFTSKVPDNDSSSLSEDFFTVVIPSALFSLVGGCILFFASDLISEALLDDTPQLIVQISSIMVVNETIWRTLGFYLKSRKMFKAFSSLTIVYQFLPYLGLVFGIVYTSELWLGLTCMAVIQGGINAVLFISTSRRLKFKPPSVRKLREFVTYSWPLALSNISGGLLAKSDRFLISFYIGPSAVGTYSILYMILSFIDQLTTPLRTYYGSYLPKLWDNGETRNVLKQLDFGISMFTCVACLLLCLSYLHLSNFLALFVGGVAVESEDNWQYTLLTIGAGIVLLGLTRFQFQLVRLTKKNQYELLLQVIGLAVSIVLNVLLLPEFGLLGAGVATLFGYLTMFIAGSVFLKPVGFGIPWKLMAPGVVGFMFTILIFQGTGSAEATATVGSLTKGIAGSFLVFLLMVLSTLVFLRKDLGNLRRGFLEKT